MALRWLDSFDHYVTADLLEKYTSSAGTVSLTPTGGRRSSGAFQSSNFTSYVLRGPFAPAPHATAIAGFAYKPAVLPGGTLGLFEFRSGATVQVSLSLTSTGLLQVRRGTTIAGTLLGTASAPITATFVYIEWKVAIDAAAGTVVLRVNEAEVLNLTAQNTSATGLAAWDTIAVGNVNSAVSTTQAFDDLYLCDGSGAAPHNDFLGDCRVDARYPTAEGTGGAAWTPLSGTDNALMVDETAPDDDTTYNSTTTVGATDTLVVQDAPVPGAALLGVQLVTSLKKSDAGTCSVAPVVRHASVDYPGTATNPGTSYAYAVTPYGLNPGTGAAWTESEFNAAEFGYKRTA